MIYIVLLILFLCIELIYFKIADRYNIIDQPNNGSSYSNSTVVSLTLCQNITTHPLLWYKKFKYLHLLYNKLYLKSIEVPIIPDFKKSPRLQFLDPSVLNCVLGISAQMLPLNDLSQSYKGAIIPHIITQELIFMQSKKPIYPGHSLLKKENKVCHELHQLPLIFIQI